MVPERPARSAGGRRAARRPTSITPCSSSEQRSAMPPPRRRRLRGAESRSSTDSPTGARAGGTPMKLHTYLNVGGNCAEAFRFYEKHLGATMGMMMTHAQAPGGSPAGPDWKDKVLHARITLGGTDLMGADIPQYQPMRSAYLSLSVEADAEAERIFSVLSEGGEIFMPMQETF